MKRETKQRDRTKAASELLGAVVFGVLVVAIFAAAFVANSLRWLVFQFPETVLETALQRGAEE